MPCPYYNSSKESLGDGICCDKIDGRPGVKFWSAYCKSNCDQCPYMGGEDPYEYVKKKEADLPPLKFPSPPKDTELTKFETRVPERETHTGAGSSGYGGSSGTVGDSLFGRILDGSIWMDLVRGVFKYGLTLILTMLPMANATLWAGNLENQTLNQLLMVGSLCGVAVVWMLILRMLSDLKSGLAGLILGLGVIVFALSYTTGFGVVLANIVGGVYTVLGLIPMGICYLWLLVFDWIGLDSAWALPTTVVAAIVSAYALVRIACKLLWRWW